jgi:hypothetical protein
MRIIRRYTTESESVYTIDWTNKLWDRKQGPDATKIRTPENGTFYEGKILYDGSVHLILPKVNPDADLRYIHSTKVVAWESLMYCNHCNMMDLCDICGASTHCGHMEDTYLDTRDWVI